MLDDVKNAVLGKFTEIKDILLLEDEKIAIAQGGKSESESEEETAKR